MVDVGVTIEEARWLNEESARHTSDDETPREEALDHCRILLGRYGGADELASLTVVDAGPCMDGTESHDRHDAPVRYQVGRFAVCRDHAITRLRARRHAEKPILSTLTPRITQPADLLRWTIAVAHAIDAKTMRSLLTEWRVDADTMLELLDLAAEIAQEAA